MKKSNGRNSNSQIAANRNAQKRDFMRRLRALFSSKLILPSVLAAGLAGGMAFAQETPTTVVIDATNPMVIEDQLPDGDIYQLNGGAFSFFGTSQNLELTLGEGGQKQWAWGEKGGGIMGPFWYRQYAADQNGKILVSDEQNATFTERRYRLIKKDAHGLPIQKKDENGAFMWGKDAQGNRIPIWEYEEDSSKLVTEDYLETLGDNSYDKMFAQECYVGWQKDENGNDLITNNNGGVRVGNLTINSNVNLGKDALLFMYGGNITLQSVDTKDENGKIIKEGQHQFGTLDVEWGNLDVYGKSDFNGAVEVNGGAVDLSSVRMTYSGVLNFYDNANINKSLAINAFDCGSGIVKRGYVNVEEGVTKINGDNNSSTKELSLNGGIMNVKANAKLELADAKVEVGGLSYKKADGTDDLYRAQLYFNMESAFSMYGSTIDIKNGGVVNIYSSDFSTVKGNGVATADSDGVIAATNSGNVINVKDGGYLWVAGDNTKNWNGTVINASKGAFIGGTAHNLNTEIYFDGGDGADLAKLQLTNALSRNLNIESDNVQDSIMYYFTKDEQSRSTYLRYDQTKRYIQDAINAGEVLSSKISTVEGTNVATIEVKNYVEGSYWDITDNTSHTNGYTVVFDAHTYDADGNIVKGATNDQFVEYGGNLEVNLGTVAFKGDTVFGNGQGFIGVMGEVAEDFELPYASSDGVTHGRYFHSGGNLAFYRDETGVSTLNTNVIMFANIEYSVDAATTAGPRLWLDADFTKSSGDGYCYEKSSGVDYSLGTIKSNLAMFSPDTEVWYDGVSAVPTDKDMTFTIQNADGNATNIVLASVKMSASVDDGGNWTYSNPDAVLGIVDGSDENKANVETFEEIFGGAQLLDASYNTDSGVVTVNTINVKDFAYKQNLSEEEREYAGQLDQLRLNSDIDSNDREFLDAVYNETDAGKVTQTIRNLARFSVISPQLSGHLGSPESSFCNIGSGVGFLGGVSGLVGGSTTLRGQTPNPQLAQHDSTLPSQSAIADMNATRRYSQGGASNNGRFLWANYTYNQIDGDSYKDGGLEFDEYKVRRQGVVGGWRRNIDAETAFGLVFAVSTPEVSQDGKFGQWNAGYASKMEMTDIQFAGHFEKNFLTNWELSLFVGGGAQTFDWERNVNDDLYDSHFKYVSEGTGNTFTATAHLARRVEATDQWTLRPTIGISSEHSWLFGFEEEDKSVANQNRSGYLAQTARRYHYDEIQYSRNIARVGLSSVMSGRQGLAGITAKAFYNVQLGGEDAAITEMTALRDDDSWNREQDDWRIQGNAMGRESLHLGGGGFCFLNPQKTLSVNGEYNALMYDNATTQNVAAGLKYVF